MNLLLKRGWGRGAFFRIAVLIMAVSPAAAAEHAAPPNVILITIDSLRADHVGCYGYARDTTPFLDAFARTATRYQNCFSPATWTVPANYSMVTSLYLPEHRVDDFSHSLASDVPTIFSVLAAHGYANALFGCHEMICNQFKKNYQHFFAGFGTNTNGMKATEG
ncbi:MAG: sulfatase-like hydrolase/transferase [Candidatus Omnitrophica bacterium]|nr:sulfatase-like hydrolase/transferase [Candidatus Omnitrophota bacterium]